MSDHALSVTGVLETAREAAEDKDHATVGDVMNQLGDRAHGPALLLLSLVALAPVIAAIPGVTIGVAALVVLLMVHLLVSSGGFFLPNALAKRSVDADTLDNGLDRARPWVERLEKVTHPRFPVMLHPVSVYVAAAVCIVLALTMFPLAVIPFASAAPAAALALFGLALVSRDGIVMALAFAVSIFALGFAWDVAA